MKNVLILMVHVSILLIIIIMNVYNIWIKYNVNNNKMNVIIININVI